MRRNVMVGLLALCVLIVGGIATIRDSGKVVAQDTDLLPAMVQGCKDAVASIRSGKGTVKIHSVSHEYEGDTRKTLETEETYTIAFEGPKYKISGEQLYLKNELSIGERRILPGSRQAVAIAFDGQDLMTYEERLGSATVGPVAVPRMAALHKSQTVESVLVLPPSRIGLGEVGKGIQRIDLFPTLPSDETDKGLKVTRRESLDGHECVIVERVVDGDTIDYIREYWVDPERGFTVPRVREWAEGGPLKGRCITFEAHTELRNYGNGVWGPAKYTYEQGELDGKGGMRPSFHYETTYDSDFRLNASLTADDLRLKLPSEVRIEVLDSGSSPQ